LRLGSCALRLQLGYSGPPSGLFWTSKWAILDLQVGYSGPPSGLFWTSKWAILDLQVLYCGLRPKHSRAGRRRRGPLLLPPVSACFLPSSCIAMQWPGEAFPPHHHQGMPSRPPPFDGRGMRRREGRGGLGRLFIGWSACRGACHAVQVLSRMRHACLAKGGMRSRALETPPWGRRRWWGCGGGSAHG